MTALPLDEGLRIGFMTGAPDPASARSTAELADRLAYDSLFVGDHVAFAVPILDPLLQLAQLAAFSSRVQLATGVYLLPLRHPVPTAKQIATLDNLCQGRVVLGGWVGGGLPGGYAGGGIAGGGRGARASAAGERPPHQIGGPPGRGEAGRSCVSGKG
jgi:alkanesulfonate monooxygenase SsuD/methylene tetrahydromethanopterin reductase-like flavin-dependent oxidoreductase (luciferase family)